MGMLGVPPERRDELEAAALAAPPDAGGIEVHGIGEDGATITGVGPDATPGLVWRAALEAADSSAAAILRNMETVAGPRRRLVVAGGWAEGAAARHVKAAHLGPSRPPRRPSWARAARR